MTPNATPWFKEVIKDGVVLDLQAHGGLLDNTMKRGDVNAGIIKFPFMAGRSEMYELTGAWTPIAPGTKGLSTVSVTPKDFQGSEAWFTQDAYKSGPQEQLSLRQLAAGAVRRKRDGLKLDALEAFQVAQPVKITTIGTGVEVPDLLHYERGRAEMAGFGDMTAEGDVFALVPEMYASQLKFYKEFANKDWTAPEDAPWSKTQRWQMRTLQGVTYIIGPDEYFKSPAGQPTQLYTWMWHRDALGAEMPIDMENAQLNKRIDIEGHPYQLDVFLSGAAIGLRPELVKRFNLAKITAPIRPV